MMAYLIMVTLFLFAINVNTTSAISLNCTFNILIPAYVGEIYHCLAKIMDANGEKLIAVNGTHQFGKGNTDVQGLTAYNNALPFLPVNIEEFFPNIVYLDFSLNQISYVNHSHLAPFPNLLRLNLNSNKITQLESKLFFGLHLIKFINFSNNNVKHIGHDFILPEVGEALFSTNPCININAINRDQLIALRLSLLQFCPPTISQIESTLESRSNFITKTNVQVQSLQIRTDNLGQSQLEMSDDFQILATKLSNVSSQLENLEQDNFEIHNEMRALISEVQGLVTKMDKLELNQLEIRTDLLTLSNKIATIQTEGRFLMDRIDNLDQRLFETTDEVKIHGDLLKNVIDEIVELEERVTLLESDNDK